MNFSKLAASSILLLVGAILIVEASYGRSSYRHSAKPSYSDSGSHGHSGRSHYAAPAVYGGRGLYNYHGYTRHYPAPPMSNHGHYRQARSYSAPSGSYRSHSAPASHHYGMRPVHVVAIAPASYGGHRMNRHYRQAKAAYRPLSAPSYGYKQTAYSRHYGPARPSYGGHHRSHQSHGYRRPAAHGGY